MSAVARRSIVALKLPEDGVARFAFQFGLAFAGSILLALSSKVSVMLGPVDLSMQSLTVMLLATAFGFRLGIATVLLYLAEGAMGFPVFQGTPEKGIGLAYMAGPTAGYLVGFVLMAGVMGWAADRGWDRSVLRLAMAGLIGTIVLLGCGYAWLTVLFGHGNAWAWGVGPFILPAILKLGLAAIVPAALWAILSRE
ncbi:MAG: biotin transporter BioY [Pseudomonadota bacterium]